MRKTFFRRNTDVFQGKMTRRTAKRPAVRVRWEFSDTPYAQTLCYLEYFKKIVAFLQILRLYSIYYADCRLSLLSAQKGKCSVSGELFLNSDNIVCHMLLFESIERRKPDSVAVRQYKVFKLAAGRTAKSSPPSRRRCPSDCSMPG